MHGRRLAAFALAVLVSSGAARQSAAWLQAYDAGDYATAAEHLHRLVAYSHGRNDAEDASPARHLATMYSRGLGVPQDRILACALARHADILAQNLVLRYRNDPLTFDRLMTESSRFVHAHCGLLSREERVAAEYSVGCNAFGLPGQPLAVGPHVVTIDRRGLSMLGRVWIAQDYWSCPTLIVGLRPVTVEAPADALPGVTARHFVDLLTWHIGRARTDQRLIHVLQWRVFAVDSRGIFFGGEAELLTVPHWPGLALPPEMEPHVTFEMIRTGHVRWRIDGNPPRRGWIMRGEMPR